ncbi:helix-turn-helix domain-containing protein [Epibacterium ulvae]|uniref:helix-turn-helix domain-containing protein n=1 Tax=Epibacterium ulvae TaxID=1156985 RepID=UPI002492B921|nr:XRE family transcriptional regulator [Epibacterium ulvae]
MSPNDLIARAIKRERNRKGMSLSALAEAADLAKSTLSNLEAGKGNPSIETLWAIAEALGVTFSTLFEVSAPELRLIRAYEGATVDSDHAPYQTTLLDNCPVGVRRDLYRVDLEPGAPRRSSPHPAGTVEHVVICRGQARVGPRGEEEVLNSGDYFRYPADGTHIYEALEGQTQMIVVIETRD